MTVAAKSPSANYLGDGVTVNFGAPFRYNLASDLLVQIVLAGMLTTLRLNIDYTATPGLTDAGGTVTMTLAPVLLAGVRIRRKSARNQADDYPTSGNFPAATVGNDFDRAMLIDQEQDVALSDMAARAILAPDGEVLGPLPGAMVRAGSALGFDGLGNPIPVPLVGNAATDGALLTFAAIAFTNIPAGVDLIRTSGGAVSGDGCMGVYISDATATAGLAAACPRFCTRSLNGRYFRLLPQYGAIAISQGGALGGANDDQPAVQACLDYAKAIGCRELLWDFDVVSLRCPLRTSNADQYNTDAWAQDGQSIWVTARIKFTGLPTETHIKMLAHDGTSLETGWQNVGGNVWRGSGINLLGGPSWEDPTSYNNTFFVMENIWLDGGCDYTGVRTAVTPASPDGPDLTNKGIRQQDTSVANITLINCKITGFKGETFYVGGGNFVLKNVTMEGSNQSCFNPSTGVIHVEDCYFGNTNAAFEILGGVGGQLTNCRFYNCNQVAVTGGPAGGPGTQWNYATVNRITTQAPPWIDFIDCEWTNCGTFLGGNYLRIERPRVTDTLFVFSTALTMGEFESTYIRDMEYTIDQMSALPLINIQGAPNLTTPVPTGLPGPPNIQPIADVHMRINVHRTPLAIAANRYAIAYAVTGEVDPNSCSLSIGEAEGVQLILLPNYGGTTLQVPLTTCDGPTMSQLIGGGTPYGMTMLTMAAGPYAIPVSGPRHGMQNTGIAAAIACTMAATYTVAHGQRTRIYWYGSTAGTTFTFARNGTRLRLNADCTLGVAFDWLEVEYNAITCKWHEFDRQVYAP